MLKNDSPYLRTTKSFPEDVQQLSKEINKSYIEIALSVNLRTIGIFPSKNSATTGETWYFDNNGKHQGLRQIYTFTNFNPIPHGLDFINIKSFSRNYGEYTDGTNWYGLISGTSVLIAGQVSFYVTPTNIVFVQNGTQPVITKGIVVLEWLSNV